MNIELSASQNDIDSPQKLIIAQQLQLNAYRTEVENLKKRVEQYCDAYDSLQHQVKELLRHRFGQRSERYLDPDNPQLDLFNKNDMPEIAEADLEDETIEIKAHKRTRKPKNKDVELPRRIEIIKVNAADMQCSCGACKKVIRYEIKELLHHVPELFEIVEQRREVVACENGCDGSIKTAPAPLHILPKAKVTESFLAFLIVSKMADRQPLYHLEKKLKERHKIDCSRTNMANWLIKLIEPLQPLYNLMKDEVIEYDIASCDATNLQVLKEPNRLATTKSYVYCMRGGPPAREAVLYDYNYRRHKEYLVDWFIGFKGYIHMDADPFFDDLIDLPDINASNCNAHARRKFEAVTKQAKRKGIAKKALLYYKRLYKIERRAKREQLKPEERYLLRQQESKPIMTEFKTWLDEVHPNTLPQSPLGQAISYCANHWSGLIRFLDDGRLEIDNNLTEQQIKPFVIARKNFLFAASENGARALCMHFSIIRTAAAHKINPYQYYEHILKQIPYCKTVEDYEKLLPWNFAKDPPACIEN